MPKKIVLLDKIIFYYFAKTVIVENYTNIIVLLKNIIFKLYYLVKYYFATS